MKLLKTDYAETMGHIPELHGSEIDEARRHFERVDRRNEIINKYIIMPLTLIGKIFKK